MEQHNKHNDGLFPWGYPETSIEEHEMHRVSGKRAQYWDAQAIVKLCYGNQPKTNITTKYHYGIMVSRKPIKVTTK